MSATKEWLKTEVVECFIVDNGFVVTLRDSYGYEYRASFPDVMKFRLALSRDGSGYEIDRCVDVSTVAASVSQPA